MHIIPGSIMDLILLFFLSFLRIFSAKNEGLFKSMDNTRMVIDYRNTTISEHSKILCTQLCVNDQECVSANFHNQTLSCELSWFHPYNNASDLKEEDGWTLIFRTFMEDTWINIFRGTPMINISIAESFIGTNANTLPVPDPGCYLLNGYSCNTHIRSEMINHWKTLNITQVKVEMLKDGETVAYIIFQNKVTDDKTSWFSQENILNSSWTDLPSVTADYPYFQLERITFKDTARSFHVFHNFGGCTVDKGWMFVSEVEGQRYCNFDFHNEYPVFIYSTVTTQQNFKSAYGLADMMMVSIKRNI